jgi:tellurite resistance protein TerC
MHVSTAVWAILGTVVVAMLALDLSAFRSSRAKEMTFRSALLWSGIWIGVALAFGVFILAMYGPAYALTYLTAYLLEKSLSVDNLFVFVLIFAELRIPLDQQRRILYLGVLGALVMRALMIAAGVYLISRFHWVIYVFAALIILAAVRLLWGREKERQLVGQACVVCGKWAAFGLPVTPVIQGGAFFFRQNGHLLLTPIFVALLLIETTDLIFALDSIPAVLAVTREPFLVYSSNVFAVLGLRSLYFLLAGMADRFHYLRYGLAAILFFVGCKMLLDELVEIPGWLSLAFIVGTLVVSIAASVVLTPRPPNRTLETPRA